MKKNLALAFILMFIYGCVKPYVYRHPNRPESFIATGFNSVELLDNYGEGYKNFVKNKLAGVNDYNDVKRVWLNAQKAAVPKLLEAKGLIPPVCLKGITITSVALEEGGQVSAMFVCNLT